MQINDFITPNSIIRDASVMVADPEFKKGLTLGWYRTQIRSALDEMAFASFFQKATIDTDYPEYDQMEMPKGVFNIQEIYLYNSDCFEPKTAVKAYWKRQFNNNPFGDGYTSGRMLNKSDNFQTNTDPFSPRYYPNASPSIQNDIYLFNVQNGLIMFSTSCAAFKKVRIVYSGTYGAWDEVPCVPRYFREYIIHWIGYNFFTYMSSLEPRIYRVMMEEWNNKLYNIRSGSYWLAKKRATAMDGKQREDLLEYFSHGNW